MDCTGVHLKKIISRLVYLFIPNLMMDFMDVIGAMDSGDMWNVLVVDRVKIY